MSELHRFMKSHGLRSGGKAHVFYDRQGQPVLVRQATTRTRLRGEEDFGAEDGGDFMGAYGPDYMAGTFSPNYMAGPEDFGEEDGELVGYDEFGRRVRLNRHPGAFRSQTSEASRGGQHRGGGFFHRRRLAAQNAPLYEAPTGDTSMNSHVNVAGAVPSGWCNTVVNNQVTSTGAGSVQVQIRLQHDFLAQDVTFDGSTAGSTVSSIFFGDRLVWGAQAPVPVTIFAVNGFIRNFVNGQRLTAGLDIVVNGVLPGAGTLIATFTGAKPYQTPMAG